MTFAAPNNTRFWADLIVEELVRCRVDTFFVAPGSRSTPLTTAVAAHPAARAIVHFDERGTAFAALGYGRATGRPAAWITTSGTALANGFPAVIEASADAVPLLLLTADRPPELRASGANQTIDQVKLYGGYVRCFFDLPAPDPDLDPAFVLTTVDQAVHRSRRQPGGPVHLNCMFREPLAPSVDELFDASRYEAELDRWSRSASPFTQYEASSGIAASAAADWAERLQGIERGIVVAGKLDGPGDGRAGMRLAQALGWPLFADVGSSTRFGPDGSGGQRIAAFDHVLGSEAFSSAHAPEAVVHLGRRVTSKRWLHYVERYRPELYLTVAATPERLDPTHQLTHRVEASPQLWAEAVSRALPQPRSASAWLGAWQSASHAAAKAVEAVLVKQKGITEPGIARVLTRHLPDGSGLFVGNSMPIRDVDTAGASDGPAVPVAANRGASGIDGLVATAAGYAVGLGQPVTALVGDLSLLHDLNSLALLRQLPVPVTVVVVNNDGGGIFHFLPIASHASVFEPYFGTPHGVGFESAAELFGLGYHAPSTPDAFQALISAPADASRLIEVRTERTANRALHRELLEAAAAAVETTLA